MCRGGGGGNGKMSAKYVPAGERSRYSEVKWRFFLADIALSAVFLLIFQLVLSTPLSDAAMVTAGGFYSGVLIYGSSFLLFMYLTAFPLHFAGTFLVEHRFGLSDQKFKAWLTDEFKSAALAFLLWMICIVVFYLVVRNFPGHWWIITAFLWILFSVILARFMPVLLIPLFFKYMPIEDASMRDRIMRLAAKCRIDLVDVCQIDFSRKTRKANAALVGLGKTRKVIMADTLLKEFTPDEAETVVAHEFGHYKFGHIWQLLGFSGAVTVAGFFLLAMASRTLSALFGASGPGDVHVLPAMVLFMSAFGIAALPFQNWFSRRLEREADSYALDMTGVPGTFISVMAKLASMNQAETDPPLIRKIFVYNHPPISERIKMAKGMRRS